MALTPMMQQYFKVKEEYPDCILFYRLGDFYEMFFDDAEIAAKELELVLTGRDCGLEERAPMCGVPYHAARNYIGRMVEKGYKIAICEQLEDPSLAKGIVKRDVVKVITPGTINDETFLKENKNNYLMAALLEKDHIALAITDITTGEYYTTSFKKDFEILKGEMAKYSPREYLLFKEDELEEFLRKETTCLITRNERYLDGEEEVRLNREFESIEGDVELLSQRAVLGLLNYLKSTQKMSLSNLTHLISYEVLDTMALDFNTRRNLELTENIVDKGRRGTLLSVLDNTETAMGARNLRRWIEKPLIRKSEIEKRLDAVDTLTSSLELMENLKEVLSKVYDMERISSKVSQKTINAREMLSLKNSLLRIPLVKELLNSITYGELDAINKKMDDLKDVASLIEESICDSPSLTLKEGNLIKEGYSKEIDELKDIRTNGKNWIAALEQKEREFTGISSLKIGYNKVFGYYIEISRANFNKIPEGRYIRKQTLANAERFITDELKEMEDKILGAEEKLNVLEYDLFISIRDKVEEQSTRIRKTAALIADLDCYLSFARIALNSNYVRPTFNENGKIEIKEGRHPVVETMIPRGDFVDNDTLLDYKGNNFLIITGPNMSGKSTYMRQVALIVLMAQLGSFVPASFADISITDRIFTRIGASDDLSGGKSTFMVEMYEVSNILKNATRNSLILLDEVGRGTSTYDGLSIAWAVTEFIMGDNGPKSRTLFATHYHELIQLEKDNYGIKNYSIAVKELKGEVIFLRKIVKGGADESYGIEVARLAGLPKDVIKRAREILKTLEGKDKNKKFDLREELLQLNMMDFIKIQEEESEDPVVRELKGLDVNNMTPMEALGLLSDLVEKVKERDK